MSDREIIVAGFEEIVLACDNPVAREIALDMQRVTLQYHDALEAIKRKVMEPADPDTYSRHVRHLEPQPKDDGYHDQMAAVHDIREGR